MSSELKVKINQLHHKFYDLSLRERVMIMVTGIVAIVMVGYLLVLEPMMVAASNDSEEAKRLENMLTSLDLQVLELEADLQQDPDAALKNRLSATQLQISELDQNLINQTQELVPASQMPLLLENVLKQSNRLKLLELQSIAPTKLLNADESEGIENNLFQHGVKITLQGKYFDVYQYLQEVEKLPWRFFWKKFVYRVDEYPLAKVEIELYTLSTNKAFIGVADER